MADDNAAPPEGRFIQAFDASGFEFHHLLVWVKQHFVIGMADYHYRLEAVLYGWRPGDRHSSA